MPTVEEFLNEEPLKKSLTASEFLNLSDKDVSKQIDIPTISSAPEPSTLSKASDVARRQISWLIGPTEQERLEKQQLASKAQEMFPGLASVRPDISKTEGLISAAFTPSYKTLPEELSQKTKDKISDAVGKKTTEIVSGAYNPIASMLNMMVGSPGGIASFGLTAAPQTLRTLAGLSFGVPAAVEAVKQAPKVFNTVIDKDASLEKKSETVTQELLNVLVATGGLSSLKKRGMSLTKERAVPVEQETTPMAEKPTGVNEPIVTPRSEAMGVTQPFVTPSSEVVPQTQPQAVTTEVVTPKITADEFLNKTVPASESIIDAGPAKITSTGKHILDPFSDFKTSTKTLIDEVAGLPDFNEYKKSINEWNGNRQINTFKIREDVTALQNAVPDKTAREAITNYIQAGGDEGVLASWRDATDHPERKKSYDKAMNLNDSEKAVAGEISKQYESHLAQAQEWGILEDGLSNYVNQVWEDPLFGTAPTSGSFTGKFNQNFSSAKERVFENFFSGEQAGYNPLTKDISELSGLYADGLNKAISTRKLIKDLTTRTASDGRPIASPVGAMSVIESGSPKTDPTFIRPTAKGALSDYRIVDHPAMYKWKWVGQDSESNSPQMMQGQLGIHPEYYAHLKNILGKSSIAEWYDSPGTRASALLKKTFKTIDKAQQVFKGTALGALSPFHQVQEATHAAGHKINPLYNLPELKSDNPVLQTAVKHGLSLAGDTNAMSEFMEAAGGGKDNPINKIPVFGEWAKNYSTYLFHEYIPKLKLKTYEAIEGRNMERYKSEISNGKISPEQVKYLSAHQTNAAYGHLNYVDLGRNPTFQHFLRMTLLAPDFLEARSRFVGQAAKGAMSKVGHEQLTALATLASTFWITSRIWNKVNDNDYHFDHPFEYKHGNRYYAFRSVPEDMYKLIKDWRGFASGRLSPLIGRGALELSSGRNYRGERITFTEEMRDMATRWIPLYFQNTPLVKKISGTSQNSPISMWEQFVSASGLQTKRYSPIQDVTQMAKDWSKKQGVPEDRSSYQASKYTAMRYALEDGDLKRARNEYVNLIKDYPAVKIVKGFKQSVQKTYTDNQLNDLKFFKSLDAEGKKKFAEAHVLKSQILNNFIKIIAQPK